MSITSKVNAINQSFASLSLTQRLLAIVELIPDQLVFTTSLGKEDQVLLWAIQSAKLPIRLVTLQTGRLFPETLALLDETRNRYDVEIEEIRPSEKSIADYVERHGLNGFYDSVEARKACCGVRKIEPLNRALDGAEGWITGLTREQSEGRGSIAFAEWDQSHHLFKFNPLADISAAQIEALILEHDIPVNVLHARGFPSIGCEPCTRAIKPGEHHRAGRWWWENNASSECGLHVDPQAETVA